jgi:hypothetical protein
MIEDQLNLELLGNPALKQKRWWGRVLIFFGGAMILLGLGYTLLNILGDLWLAFLGIIFSYVGVKLINRGKRHFVPVGLAELKRDSRPPVLYLRPFTQDGGVNLMTTNAINRGFVDKGFWRQVTTTFIKLVDTYEQYISLAFKKIGPVVAIGDPTGRLPQLGAIRIYVGIDGDWQQMVSKLASKASYVLLQIGKSDGLMWEVQYVIDQVRPEQLILFLPNQNQKFITRLTRRDNFQKREQERQNVYQVFRTKTQDFFPEPLPVDIGSAMFIYFDHDWEPVPTYFQSESIFSFKRKRSETSIADPKLEALNWLNSILC